MAFWFAWLCSRPFVIRADWMPGGSSMTDSNSLLIRGGRVIDPSQKMDQSADVLIEDGRIKAIDQPGKIPAGKAHKEIDARNAWVLPGLIDVHVHLREPGLEYKETIETGTHAAVAGGFTSVACM